METLFIPVMGKVCTYTFVTMCSDHNDFPCSCGNPRVTAQIMSASQSVSKAAMNSHASAGCECNDFLNIYTKR